MKTPLFNEIERQIISEDNSLTASNIKLFIARKRFEKAFMGTSIGRFIKKSVDVLATYLAKQ